MPDRELSNLESQIDNFVKIYQQVTLENISLRKKLTSLSQDQALIRNRKKEAVISLRNIITQLKDELTCLQK